MLVYYQGIGFWCRQVDKDIFEILEYNNNKLLDYEHHGVFLLPEQYEKDIKYQNVTDAVYLLPCTDHPDGAVPKKYNNFAYKDDIVFCFINDKEQFIAHRFTESDVIIVPFSNPLSQSSNVATAPFSNSQQTTPINPSNSSVQKKTSDIDLKRLECLKKHITWWEATYKTKFKIDPDYSGCQRKIIPISGEVMLQALKKEFNNNNLSKLKASKLENTSFWKSAERKDICVLSKRNNREINFENKIITDLKSKII